RSIAHRRRLLGRLGGGRRRGPCPALVRHRHQRLDPRPRGAVRRVRTQADVRTRLARRRRTAGVVLRPLRAVRAPRGRSRGGVRCDRRARPPRSRVREAAVYHLDNLRTRAGDFDPMTRDRLLATTLLPATYYLRAQRFREWFRGRAADVFRHADVLLAPTTPWPAPAIGAPWTTRIGGT